MRHVHMEDFEGFPEVLVMLGTVDAQDVGD